MTAQADDRAPVSYVRVYSGDDGETHLEPGDLAMQNVAFAPPSPPLDLSTSIKASQANILRLSPAWNGESGAKGEWHCTPAVQWLFYLRGEMNLAVSDGESVLLSAGSVVLLEDTTGKGHSDQLIGDSEVVIAAVRV